MTTTDRHSPRLEKLRTELTALRDELRVQIRLAGMDAKDAYRDLEPKLQRIERELAGKADDATDALADAFEKLATKFRALKEKNVVKH